MNFVHCLHIVLFIGIYTDVFRWIFSDGGEGWVKEVKWEDPFHGGIFMGEGKFF